MLSEKSILKVKLLKSPASKKCKADNALVI
jgi:hypothetical protein